MSKLYTVMAGMHPQGSQVSRFHGGGVHKLYAITGLALNLLSMPKGGKCKVIRGNSE